MSGKAWVVAIVVVLLLLAFVVLARGRDRAKIPGAFSVRPVEAVLVA